MKVDFNAQAKEFGLNKGEYFKIQDGDNRFRIMSESIGHESIYKPTGKKNFKMLCYVIDRRDGEVKPYYMPPTIFNQIADLQTDPEYKFDEVPMPYDFNLKATSAGTIEVKYTLVAARQPTPVTAGEMEKFEGMVSIQELKKKLDEKQKNDKQGEPEVKDTPPTPDEEKVTINPDDVPF